MLESIPITDARKQFLGLVQQVARGDKKVLLTRHGRPAAVLVSAEEYFRLEETLDLLLRSDEVRRLLEALPEAPGRRP